MGEYSTNFTFHKLLNYKNTWKPILDEKKIGKIEEMDEQI